MIREILKRIFYPNDFGCIICGKRGKTYYDIGKAVICDECIKTFIKVEPPLCQKCGRPIKIENSLCEMCARYDFEFDSVSSVFVYEGSLRQAIHNLKYHDQAWLTEFAAKAMSEKLYSIGFSYDIITYVPMYRKKEHARGYNQAKLLAEKISSLTGIKCVSTLIRTKNTTPQSMLDKHERMNNISGAININNEFRTILQDKSILVIDDILTTGSSLNECAKILKSNGANKVYGLCLCAVKE